MTASWADRKNPQTICLFDVDGTLTPARKTISAEMMETLRALKKECVIGFVGGSVGRCVSARVDVCIYGRVHWGHFPFILGPREAEGTAGFGRYRACRLRLCREWPARVP